MGRGQVEASEWFQKKSVSPVDRELPAWAHKWSAHAQTAHLHDLPLSWCVA